MVSYRGSVGRTLFPHGPASRKSEEDPHFASNFCGSRRPKYGGAGGAPRVNREIARSGNTGGVENRESRGSEKAKQLKQWEMEIDITPFSTCPDFHSISAFLHLFQLYFVSIFISTCPCFEFPISPIVCISRTMPCVFGDPLSGVGADFHMGNP